MQPRRPLQFQLRTLVVAAAIGPVLLALFWFVGLWLWISLPDLLRQWSLSLAWMGVYTGLLLAIVSLVWPPNSDETQRASRRAVCLIGGLFFVALWTNFWPSFGILGWLLIWGDNESHWERNLVWLWSLIAAAMLTANFAMRGLMGMVARPYAFTIALLAVLALLPVAPIYLGIWWR